MPQQDRQRILAYLASLVDETSLVEVATRLGHDPDQVERILCRRDALSPKFVGRLFRAYEPPPELADIEIPTDVEGEHAWVARRRKIAIEALGRAMLALDAITDAEWITLHPAYVECRDALLVAAPDLEDVIPEPPTDGPALTVDEARTELLAVITESEEREASITNDANGKFALLHTRFRADVRAKLRKIARQAPMHQIAKTSAWRALIVSICEAVRLDADARTDCIDALGLVDAQLREMADPIADALSRVRAITFPCTEYADDPEGFIRTIIGREPWEGQLRFIQAVADGHKWTVVHTGHKVGKTAGVAWLIWWWVCTRPEGRIVIANFTGQQLEKQDWFEISKAFHESGVCVECRKAGVTSRPCKHSQVIDGALKTTAIGGWKSPDGNRFVIGVTGDDPTATGGYSGATLGIVIDEFSGMRQNLFDGWQTSTSAKGSWLLGVGNPIGQDGPMYDAVMNPRVAKQWMQINISSEEAAKTGIPGLADSHYLAKIRDADERGVESPFYMIRARGLYPTVEEQSAYPMRLIIEAQQTDHYDMTPGEGQLIVSLDPAKAEGTGDQGVWAATRGLKVYEFVKGRGWDDEAYLHTLIDLVMKHRTHPSERAIFAVDGDGPGASIIRRVNDYMSSRRVPEHEKVYVDVVPVYFGQVAHDEMNYDLVGDEAHTHLARWLRNGGTFPTDPHLEVEMQITKWYPVRRRRRESEIEVLSATRKDGPNGYRKSIHRSPDTLDALRVMAFAAFMRDVAIVQPKVAIEAKRDIDETKIEISKTREAFRATLYAQRAARLARGFKR